MANSDSLNSTAQLASQLGGAVRQQKVDVATSAAQSGNNLPQTEEPVAAQPAPLPSNEQLEATVATLSDFVQSIQRDLSFSVDDNTGRTVIVVTDGETGDVVRQIPSEELLQLARNLQDLQEKLESSKGNLLEVRV